MKHQQTTWMIICDFDGTISTLDATDELLEAHAMAAWLEVEQAWLDNRITSKECLQRQAGLIRADSDQVQALADRLTIAPDFAEFVDWCATHELPIVVVSDGFDVLIARILSNHGLGHLPVYSNQLRKVTPCTWQLDTPHCEQGCASSAAVCKCAVIERLKTQTGCSHALLIGDGRSDICAAENAADRVVAKSTLRRHMADANKPFVPFDCFNDVISAFASDIVGLTPLAQSDTEQ